MTGRRSTEKKALEIRVRGRVQGVGFRPNVHRLAHELGLAGQVMNDAEGVLIHASGTPRALASFLERIVREAPPLARVEDIETRVFSEPLGDDFLIAPSSPGLMRTEVAPDAAVCTACTREVLSSADRRFRYPFTTCTHCGPRLSIVRAAPYDRVTTTLASFPLCAACDAEYGDVADRRFHAEATACPACGPRVRLERFDGSALDADMAPPTDVVDAAFSLIQRGEILAVKGLGGYQIACDATRGDVVTRLRRRKGRDAKPFALMARDLDVIRRYCVVSPDDERLLMSPEGPIVLLDASGVEALPEAVAPGHRTLGFMVPTTPLHVLLLRRADRPVVMTSGNASDAPPVIDDADVLLRLRAIADYVLAHDRPVANRVDDSVVRVMDGRARVLRRARGYAPAPIRLAPGFEAAPPTLGFGGDLKATFCLLEDGRAVLSQHQGDLTDYATLQDYRRNLALYAALFEHRPAILAADLHPEYEASSLARERAGAEGLELVLVQHHHAHTAACLVENGRPLDAPPVLGVVLDGVGFGENGASWGGEFLLADYRCFEQLGTLKAVALLGGDLAAEEPWRCLYAHLTASIGWDALAAEFADLDLFRKLSEKPRAVLDRMLSAGVNSPLASSCGRLFDAVAAAVGVAFDRQGYEGHAAGLLEGLVERGAGRAEVDASAYPFSIDHGSGDGPVNLESRPMWHALLRDLASGTPPGIIAGRFHSGLARAITGMATSLRGDAERARFHAVALSGGCFQNRVLFEDTSRRLRAAGFDVLTHAHVPPNDGGLALGQVAIAAARYLRAASGSASPPRPPRRG